MILQQEGASIIRQGQVLHGVETEILADPSSVTYREITGPIHVGRYHSYRSIRIAWDTFHTPSKSLPLIQFGKPRFPSRM